MSPLAICRQHRELWGTPQWLFDDLDAEFRFTLDVCATPALAKCRRYFAPADDGLAQSWRGARCWMNPPYTRGWIDRWVAKGIAESWNGQGAIVVMLLPASSDTPWFQNLLRERAEFRFVRGRLRFEGDALGKTSSPFPCVVVVLRPAAYRTPTATFGASIDARGRHRA